MTSPAQQAADIIKSRNWVGSAETAVILGRNFASAADLAENPTVFRYADLPGFPRTPATADGEIIVGLVDGAPTIFLKGRANFFESGDPSLMSVPIETLALLGVRSIVATTLALSVRADLVPSSIVAVSDHINFSGLNPLIGATGDDIFLNLNEAYDKRLLRRIKISASGGGVTVHEGVLMWFSGPTFETPAEVKMARQLGADLIGWSIAPEAIIARRYGVPFAGLAVITEFGAGFSGGNPVADFTRGPAVAGVVALKRLLRAFIKSR
jgi:purine-nucleoside phosphorylase